MVGGGAQCCRPAEPAIANNRIRHDALPFDIPFSALRNGRQIRARATTKVNNGKPSSSLLSAHRALTCHEHSPWTIPRPFLQRSRESEQECEKSDEGQELTKPPTLI